MNVLVLNAGSSSVKYAVIDPDSGACHLEGKVERIGQGVTHEQAFAEILERCGGVDHLVNNAGVGGNGVVEETTPERMIDVLNVDLCGALRCIREVLPGMRELTEDDGFPRLPDVVVRMVRCLAREDALLRDLEEELAARLALPGEN